MLLRVQEQKNIGFHLLAIEFEEGDEIFCGKRRTFLTVFYQSCTQHRTTHNGVCSSISIRKMFFYFRSSKNLHNYDIFEEDIFRG